MPDRKYALFFATGHTFSTEEWPEIHVAGEKLLRERRVPGGTLQQPGTWNGDWAGES